MGRAAAAFGVAAACLVLTGPTPEAQRSVEFRDTHAQAVLQATRTAVGRGARAVEQLESLIMRGTSRVAVDDGRLTGGDVEIRILLPRHALRLDRSGDSARMLGFAGKQLLSAHREGHTVDEPPARLRNDILKAQRTWFGRLLLGSAAYVLPDLSVVFRSVFNTPAESTGRLLDGDRGTLRAGIPDPNLIEASGHDGFYLRLFLDAARLPDRIEYHLPDSGTGTMRFADRRDIDGLLLPHRITTTINGRLVDELVFHRILVNPELSESDFRVR
jgi:hypothetical protein